MIKKILKWTGIIVGSLLGLALLGYGFIFYRVQARIDKRYSFTTANLAFPDDSAAIAKGRHLALIKGCIECHGPDLAGKVLVDDAIMGRLSSANLTRGEGGLRAGYSLQDWLMALQHGVTRGGRPLLFMPSHETALLNTTDMAAIIAYCNRATAVNHTLPPNRIGPMLRILSFTGKLPLLPVEKINHTLPLAAGQDTTQGAAYGKYLSVSCAGCHSPSLTGGPAAVPGQPGFPNITASGAPGKWTQAQFINTLRTGKTPSGRMLNNDNMPWKMTAQYSDKELASLYQYLQTLK